MHVPCYHNHINVEEDINRSFLELRLDLNSPELELELKCPELELELELKVIGSSGIGIGIENNGIEIGIELRKWNWPQPWQWLMINISDLMMTSTSFLIIIPREMGKLQTHSPIYWMNGNWEIWLSLRHTLNRIYITSIYMSNAIRLVCIWMIMR